MQYYMDPKMTLKVNKKGIDSGMVSNRKYYESSYKNVSLGPSKKPFRIKQRLIGLESQDLQLPFLDPMMNTAQFYNDAQDEFAKIKPSLLKKDFSKTFYGLISPKVQFQNKIQE